MGIRKGPARRSFGLKTNKIRCWNCNKVVPVVVIDPASQNPLCQECAGDKWSGIEIVTDAEEA